MINIMSKLDDNLRSEINALQKYANRENVNLKVLEKMVVGILDMISENRPKVDYVELLGVTNEEK